MIQGQFNVARNQVRRSTASLLVRIVVRGNSVSLKLMASSPSILLLIQHVRNLIKLSFKHKINNKAGLEKVVVIYRKYYSIRTDEVLVSQMTFFSQSLV